MGGEALEGMFECKAVLEGGGEAGRAAAIVEAGDGWGEQRAQRRSGPDQGNQPTMILSKIRESESAGSFRASEIKILLSSPPLHASSA